MSVTLIDIRKNAFTNDLDAVEELTLTNRGLIDLGAIHEVAGLTSVNLSFNKLTGLTGLASLSLLSSLNASHNCIT